MGTSPALPLVLSCAWSSMGWHSTSAIKLAPTPAIPAFAIMIPAS
jgi:hypothetical protein